MNNTKDEKINLGKEYDNEKQDNDSTTNNMKISSAIVQMVAKSTDSNDEEEDRKRNKIVDNSIRLENNRNTTKEE